MKTFIYCHKYKKDLYDDIAIVRAKDKEEAKVKLSEYYTDVFNCILREISFKTEFQKEKQIIIVSDY